MSRLGRNPCPSKAWQEANRYLGKGRGSLLPDCTDNKDPSLKAENQNSYFVNKIERLVISVNCDNNRQLFNPSLNPLYIVSLLALTTAIHLVAQLLCLSQLNDKKKNILNHWVSDKSQGKKPFKCESCDHDCGLKGNLQHHTNSVHEGKKPFRCESCDKGCAKGKGQETKIFAFKFVTAGQITKIIKKLNNTKALGVDNIGTDVWKKGVISLAGPIARLCNLSLASGIIPDLFKNAIIHPVYKGQGKNPKDPGSYRPIAILPAISKILETVVRDNILEWFEHTGYLPDSQFGFLPRRSVDMALIITQNDLIKAKSEGYIVGAMALDLSCAFDTLEHSTLIKKLESAGISGTALKWFTNYLSERSQCVLWNGNLSTP